MAVADIAAVHDPLSAPLRLRPATDRDLDWMVERHAAIYRAEQGWDDRFAAIVADVVAEFRARADSAEQCGFVVEHAGARLGCALVMRDSAHPHTAKLRLLLVEPQARRRGLGQQLVDACVAFARDCGYRTLSLWTESVLADARRLYQRNGFCLLRTVPHARFGADLRAETWELTL